MFDIGASELLVIIVVAILVIGPKEMPRALRTAGRWIGKMRRMSNHFRSGIDSMIREAELEDAEKEWKDRNAKIMAETPGGSTPNGAPQDLLSQHQMEPLDPPPVEESDAAAEAAIARAAPVKSEEHSPDAQRPPTKPGKDD